ncbi:MAG: septal ring lytic transglycosylase RlpA family protein [Patescibacteria group bacterium]
MRMFTIAALVLTVLSATPSMAENVRVSWYGSDGNHGFPKDGFLGKKMANGEKLTINAQIVAHKTLPFGTKVKFTNRKIKGHPSICLPVTDRGPFAKGREYDLSWAAALELGITEQGVASLEAKVGC